MTDDEILDTYNQIKASPDMASRLAEASEEAKKAKETAAFETNEVVTEEQISEPVKEEPEAEVPSAETQNVETDNVETQEVETPEVTYETPSVFAEPEKVEDTTPTVQNPETLTDEQLNQIINDAVTETIAYDNMQAQDNTLSPEMKQHYESVMQSFSNDPNSYEYQNAQAVLDQQAKADAEAAIESLHSRTR